MNKQETFDFVVTKLREQGEPSAQQYSCRYRLEKNGKTLKCAAGWCMSDEQYSKDFEGRSVLHDTVSGLFSDHDLGLLSDLQEAHDDAVCDSMGSGAPEWLTLFLSKARDVALAHQLDSGATL